MPIHLAGSESLGDNQLKTSNQYLEVFLQRSGQKYGALLNRASLIIGHSANKTDVRTGSLSDIESTVETTAKVAKISGNDLGVAYQLRDRVKAKLQARSHTPIICSFLFSRYFDVFQQSQICTTALKSQLDIGRNK